MPAREYAPHQLLAPYVHSFCISERHFAAPHATFDIFPDSMIELVWNIGAPCALVLPDRTFPLPACYAVGLLQSPLRITAEGLVQVVRARFYPWALQPIIGAFLRPTGLPSAAGLLWVAAELLPPAPGPAAAPHDGEWALEQLQRILLRQVLEASLDDAGAIQAARALIEQHGDIALPALAHQLGLSERSLRRRFHSAIQASPKEFARLARFEYVCTSLWQTPGIPLADIALQAGYSDQAHMQREFRAFSGRTPRQFASDMRRLRALFAADRNMQDA